MRTEDFNTGLIQRFDFFYYEGEIPYENKKNQDLSRIIKFSEKLESIINTKLNQSELFAALGIPSELHLSAEAEEIRALFSKKIIDRANKYNRENNPGFTGIVSRMYRSALKYAMIHHVSCNDNFDCDVDAESMLYGISVAELLGEWKIKVLPTKVYEGDFHRDCEIFKDAIRMSIKMEKNPTGKILANRKKRLKQLKPKEWDAIIRALKARKEIIVDETKKSTIYWLTKNTEI